MATIYAHPTLMQNRASLAELTKTAGLVVVARFTQKSLSKFARSRSPLIKPSVIALEPTDPTWPGGDAA